MLEKLRALYLITIYKYNSTTSYDPLHVKMSQIYPSLHFIE